MRVRSLFTASALLLHLLLTTSLAIAEQRQTENVEVSRTLGAPGSGFSSAKAEVKVSEKALIAVKVLAHQARPGVESALYLQFDKEKPLEVQFLQGSEEQFLLWELKGRKPNGKKLWLKVEKGAAYVESLEVSYLEQSKK